jgi:hypothetical protein
LSERVDIRIDSAPSRCPFCHAGMGPEEAVVACRDCGARHHAPCWNESSRCATCSSPRALVEPTVTQPRAETIAPPQETPVIDLVGCSTPAVAAWLAVVGLVKEGHALAWVFFVVALVLTTVPFKLWYAGKGPSTGKKGEDG